MGGVRRPISHSCGGAKSNSCIDLHSCTGVFFLFASALAISTGLKFNSMWCIIWKGEDKMTWINQTTDTYLDDVTTDLFTSAPAPPLTRLPSARLRKTLELIELGRDIHKYAMPGIFAVGFIGNILSLVIMQRPFIRKSSASVYFSALAVADTIALLYHLLYNYLRIHFPDLNLEPLKLSFSDILCKTLAGVLPFTLQWPAWLILAVTAERLLMTLFPLKGKLWCTRRAALGMVISITLILALYNSIAWYVLGLSLGRCTLTGIEGWDEFRIYFNLTLYTLLPSPLLILMNAVMIYKLLGSQRIRKRLTYSENSGKKSKADGAISRATVAAVLVSVSYFILTCPSTTINTIVVITDLDTKYPEIRLVHYIGLVFRTTNNAINFILYLISYPRIRTECVTLITTCCCSYTTKTHGMEMTARATEVSEVKSSDTGGGSKIVDKA